MTNPDAPVLFVSGASAGIGEAVARRFAAGNYRVALAARRVERLEALKSEIERAGGKALALPMDVSRLEDVQRAVAQTQEAWGRIDVLCNNAGFGRLNWLEKLDPINDVQAQIQTNLSGLIWLTQATLPGMIERRGGHIIHMASLASLLAPPTYSVYAATKFGVRGFTEGLRREVKVYGIHVSAVYPGAVATEFQQVAGIKRRTSLQTPTWLALSAEDVARAVWRLVQHPRRSVIMPALMRPAMWVNAVAPGLVDWATRKVFVERERL